IPLDAPVTSSVLPCSEVMADRLTLLRRGQSPRTGCGGKSLSRCALADCGWVRPFFRWIVSLPALLLRPPRDLFLLHHSAEMLVPILLLVLGLVILVVGAEFLVKGSARLATAVGISPLVVGLTVVAFGTSAPELAVSVM